MPELKTKRHYRQAKDDNSLNETDRKIIIMIADGLGGTQIADKMGMTDATIEVYRGKIYRKLKARNSAHMVMICFQKGILKTT